MHEPKPISYEKSRLEYFRNQKAHSENCLTYWVNRMAHGKYPDVDHPQFYMEDKCAEYGAIINYYADAIKAFGGGENE